jgi:tape measure domain-containing protein
MGGLYATVNLDIGDALKELRKLETQAQRVFKGLTGAGTANAGGQLASATRETRREVDRATNSTRQLGREFRKAGTQARGVAGETKVIGRELSDAFATTFASLGAARSGNVFYALSSGLRGAARATQTLGAASASTALLIGGITAAALAAVVAVGAFSFAIAKIARESIKSAASLETLLVSFEALLGSGERAAREFDFIVQAAKISPFFTDAIVKVDRFILAQGILNDELRQKTIKSLIDFGSAAGLTGDRLLDLGYALGQVYQAGRLTGDEARQLRNNFLGAELVLRSLPEYANITGLELKKAMEEGRVSAEDFFEAFFIYTARFEEAAAAQQQTLRGLADTILDTFQLGLGAAAIEVEAAFSPLEAVKDVLKEVLIIVDTINFEPLVASLGGLIRSVLDPFTNWVRSNGPAIADFFQRVLPNAIVFLTNVFRVFWTNVRIVFNAWVNAIRIVFTVVSSVFGSLVGPVNNWQTLMKVAAGAGAVFATVMATAMGVFASAVIAAVGGAVAALILLSSAFRSLFSFLTGQGFGAGWADGHVRAMQSLGGAWEAVSGVVQFSGAAIRQAWEQVAALEPIELPSIEPPSVPDVGGGTGIGDAFPGGGEAEGDGGAAGTDKLAQEVNKAMDTLYDLSRRWFGLRSDLERGLLGENGFEATVSQIAAMGERLLKAAITIGEDALIRTLESGIAKLIELAKQREVAAEALREAQKQLDAAIKERDAFAAKVRESALKFTNALKTESEVQRQFTLVSERGFFYETETTKQKSFVESLRERVKALKEFQANVKRLRSAGLDEGLLEEIIAAGPEQAGEVASQLAQGGQAMIDEVNTLQQSASQVADELGQFGAQEFYQAGVDMAQAQVDGLTTQLEGIEKAAIAISDRIYEAILPFAKEMEEVGSKGGGALADGIASAVEPVNEAIGGIGGTIGAGFAEINDIYDDFGSATDATMETAIEHIRRGFEDMGNAIRDEVDEWRNILPKAQGFGWELAARVLTGLVGFFLGPKIIEWYNTSLYPRFKRIWENAQEVWDEGILGAISSVISILYNLSPISWILPFEIDATKVRNLLIDAINWVIEKYNSIPFLPDISPLRHDGGGGRFVSSPVPPPPPDALPDVPPLSVGEEVFNINVYVGNEQLDAYIDSSIQGQSSASDDFVYSGPS